MNDHLLIKMTDVLHWIRPTIIKGEGWLMKSSREARTLYVSCERGPRQPGLTHRSWHYFQGPYRLSSYSYAYGDEIGRAHV